METNKCNVNHLDTDALLPPRKRLLAGLKRQNSDVNSPAPSTPSSVVRENAAHLNNVSRAHLSNPNLSNEEIVEASRIAAIEAAKVAEAARANAEDKAAKAAKAVAAAKSALELVATLSEAANKEKYQKRNKMKKHVTVEALYNKNKGNTNYRKDEELARRLHRDINSSPRILKNSPGSDTKNHKHKRMKNSAFSGRTDICGGVPVGEGSRPSTATSNENNNIVGEAESEGYIKKIDTIMVDLNTSTPNKGDQLKLDNGEGFRPSKADRPNLENSEAEALPSKDKFTESLDSFGRKRGRIKQKKLPLSICSFRDQTGPKEEMKHQGNQPMLPVERPSMWKCQSFKALACVNKQNKVMQS
ncbi:hypothetical protein CDL12_07025 [Handroanthus impetiginosus]|uniref:Uncharacterized protein n=1 Tax=Handroanthus impetiginosus TaxID=429701 RepID=A0A2G9HRZ9_9LAMI|nr:hypothetical protein CDL12_07025 [Handroanthus impetiginosus]